MNVNKVKGACDASTRFCRLELSNLGCVGVFQEAIHRVGLCKSTR